MSKLHIHIYYKKIKQPKIEIVNANNNYQSNKRFPANNKKLGIFI